MIRIIEEWRSNLLQGLALSEEFFSAAIERLANIML